MLKRSRVSRTPDVSRIGASLARPGMDTRVWCSVAVALDESVVDTDNGVFVDVKLLPTLEDITVRVGSSYAGDGFGFYAPIHKDDMLVVGLPSGDPADEVTVMQRLWNGADKPPQAAKDNANDVLLMVEKDKLLRLRVQGGGNINLIVEDGLINLGGDSLDDFVAMAQKVKDFWDSNKNWQDTHTHVDAFGGTGVPQTPSPTPQKPAAEKVKAR